MGIPLDKNAKMNYNSQVWIRVFDCCILFLCRIICIMLSPFSFFVLIFFVLSFLDLSFEVYLRTNDLT